MKPRIKIDSSILVFLIVFTAFLFQFTNLYVQNKVVDNLFDCLGLVIILFGVLIRMAARGHKKAFSQKSEELVTSGLYQHTRNPMYLGSFSLGAGFILIVWPWWSLFLFAGMFYLRFNKQMVKEEKFLFEKFGQQYNDYCKEVPRIFPKIGKLQQLNLREVFPYAQAISTKEKRGLIGWPVLAVFLETLQEQIVFGYTHVGKTFLMFMLVEVILGVVLRIFYKEQKQYE